MANFKKQSGLVLADIFRKAVLQWAIQGQLVPQMVDDGLASDLFDEILAEKKRLIDEKIIKKDKPLAPITDDEKPFDIPDSWVWVRLGDIGSWNAGATPSRTKLQYYSNGTINWLKTGDLTDGVITLTSEKITELAVKESSVVLQPVGAVLMAMYGATIGKVGLLEIEATTNQACCGCRPFTGVLNWYLFYFLIANRKNFTNMGSGGAQPNISKEKIVNTLIPLPPLAEQERIVAKLDMILPQIDELAKSENALNALQSAFPKQMQSALLQSAISGKLTEQLESDGNASDLLTQIQAKKQRLIKEKIIKKEKPLAEISDDEKPFDIPDNWAWVRLGDLGQLINGDRGKNYPGKAYWIDKGEPFINAGALNNGLLEDINFNYISESRFKLLRSGFIQKDDFLYCLRGSLGKFSLNKDFEKGAIASSICIVRTFDKKINDFLFLYFLSPLSQDMIKQISNGTAQPNLSAENVRNYLIPLPPLAEQQRIVAKLDELLPQVQALTL